MPDRTATRVSRFGGVDGLTFVDEPVRMPRGNEVVVRVTHASLGTTDALARRGGYVLQPMPGFVPGYDFVGVLESESAVSVALGLRLGAPVAGVLPRMGAHATRMVVPASLLVGVPDAIDPAVAAAVPLDGVTAALALELGGAPRGGAVLVQGAGGAVGTLAAQLARARGLRVVGTGSERSRQAVESTVDSFVDYTEPGWAALVRAATGGGAAAAIDHIGSAEVRDAVAAGGTLVHTAFAGRPGRERTDSLRGSAASAARRWGRPRERVCSVPLFVATRRNDYRRMLADLLSRVERGDLAPVLPNPVPFADAREAHRAAERPGGGKVILVMPPA